MIYLFWRWLHIIAIISWMAGLLYIFRLFIYQSENKNSKDISNLFPVMQRRLYKVITVPAMIIALSAATAMLMLNEALLTQVWMQFKIACVLGLVGFTAYAGHLCRVFAENKPETWPESRKLRFMNEGPTVLMLLIVFLVVFRPFI